MRLSRHPSRIQSYLPLLAIIVFALSSYTHADEAIPDAQESHPGLAQESRFAEAVVAYNKRQTSKALQILDELIKAAPTRRDFLEMEALALKGTGDAKKSLDVYLKLYQVTPEAEKGPYAFEVGTLLSQAGKANEAKPYFEKAVKLNFNKVPAHFYLGLGDYQQSNYAGAEKNFAVAADSDLQPFSVMSKYYLGISYFKLSNGPQGVQELVDVRRITRDAQPGDVTKTIHDATAKMLEPFNHGQWFGNVLLQSQYDSNVQQLPAGFSNPNSGNNPATAKMNFSAGGGYMTAPLDTIQWVAGYRASYNYDFNRETEGFQYFTNNASLYANYNALAKTSGGLKLESTFAFQNALEDPTNSQSGYEYQKYNFLLGGGPYFHHQINREWRMEAEAGIREQTFYADPDLSGNDYNGRVSFRSDYGRTYFNPGASVLYENDRTDSSQFFYNSYGIGILNTMNFSGAITVVETFDLVFAHYSEALPTRDDKNYALKVSGVKLVTPKFSVLADMGYVKNASNISDTYSYNQFVTSLGIGYTF
jgi:Tfp pilus assembly protein PilF